jgi:hypothetical protein
VETDLTEDCQSTTGLAEIDQDRPLERALSEIDHDRPLEKWKLSEIDLDRLLEKEDLLLETEQGRLLEKAQDRDQGHQCPDRREEANEIDQGHGRDRHTEEHQW